MRPFAWSSFPPIVDLPSVRLAEVDRQRAQATTRRELWRTALVIAAATVGGFLAGQTATCRTSTSMQPAATEEVGTPKGKPTPSRKPAR
jgi:hypothetical protein